MLRLRSIGNCRLVGIVLLVLLLAASSGAVILAFKGTPQAKGEPGGELPLPKPMVSSATPRDVEFPEGAPSDKADVARIFFDDFSWRTFLALNWPAKDNERGVANTTAKLADKSSTVVWGTWKAGFEVFQKEGAPPAAWDALETVSQVKGVTEKQIGRMKQLVSFSRFASVLSDVNLFQAGNRPSIRLHVDAANPQLPASASQSKSEVVGSPSPIPLPPAARHGRRRRFAPCAARTGPGSSGAPPPFDDDKDLAALRQVLGKAMRSGSLSHCIRAAVVKPAEDAVRGDQVEELRKPGETGSGFADPRPGRTRQHPRLPA